jgi:hypothetical protein
MVPPGKTSLCCEFFTSPGSELFKAPDQELVRLALAECARFGLVDSNLCFDHLVLRLPGVDASQNRHNWINNMRRNLLSELGCFENLYYVNRTDLDIATLAGIESAEAIISGDRTTFDLHFDPANLDIRGGRKAFEFRNPIEDASR